MGAPVLRRAPREHRSPMRQTLRLVGPDAAPQWRLMAGGTVVLLAEVTFRVMEPWPLKVVIDSLVASMGRHTGSAPAIWAGISSGATAPRKSASTPRRSA